MTDKCLGIAKKDIKKGEIISIDLELGTNNNPHSKEIDVTMSKRELVDFIMADNIKYKDKSLLSAISLDEISGD